MSLSDLGGVARMNGREMEVLAGRVGLRGPSASDFGAVSGGALDFVELSAHVLGYDFANAPADNPGWSAGTPVVVRNVRTGVEHAVRLVESVDGNDFWGYEAALGPWSGVEMEREDGVEVKTWLYQWDEEAGKWCEWRAGRTSEPEFEIRALGAERGVSGRSGSCAALQRKGGRALVRPKRRATANPGASAVSAANDL